MKQIVKIAWKEETITNGTTELIDLNTVILIRNLIRSIPPHLLPIGLDAFDIMKDLHHALKTAEMNDVIILENQTYKWIKKNVLEQIPARWGLNPDISEAIDFIRNPEEIELKPEKT